MLDFQFLASVARDPSADVRAELAAQLAALSVDPATPGFEVEAAVTIMLRLAEDTVFSVRHALADPLKASERAPRKLLFALIGDVEDISLPILASSPVLVERELVAIVQRADAPRQSAIAGRRDLTPAVAHAIAEEAPEPVCIRLLANQAAPVASADYRLIAARFDGSAAIRDSLLARSDLPVAQRVALMCAIGRDLEILLTDQAGSGEGPHEPLLSDTSDQALLALAGDLPVHELPVLIRELHGRDRLTAALVLQAACSGQMRFVEATLAFLARMPVRRARSLLHARGDLGWVALSRRCALPAAAANTIRLAAIIHQSETRTGDGGPEGDGNAMLERLMTDDDLWPGAERLEILRAIRAYGAPKARLLAMRILNEIESKAA